MQRKCHRCDRLYTPIDHNTWRPDCMAGKPVEPRKTAKKVAKENRERMEQAYKYARYCVQCGKRFYTNRASKMICGEWECEEKQQKQLLQARRTKERALRGVQND